MEIKSADYTRSCVRESDYPEKYDKVEMAFVGRSNLGKYSLINSLVKMKNLERTSKTHRRTQLINFFTINNNIYFVDVHGYGFAKVPYNI